jgi:catechol 2,3-dioxygenase-like lactoylglutathione lyase family enzyme
MITQLAHTAYRVRDLEASLAFYGKLGIYEAFRLNHDDGSVWIVYLQINRDQFLELFPGATEPVATTWNSIAYHHFCLQVDDLETTVADLESREVVIDQPIKMGKDYNLQAWIVDPDGNRIELMQIMPESPQAAAGKAFRGPVV